MTKQKGFSLVELLVVIAIIGILSTLAVIYLGSTTEKANDAKRITHVNNLKTALEIIKSENGDYSDVCTAAAASACNGLGEYISTMTQYVDPSGETPLCTAAPTAPCNYKFSVFSPSTYTLDFWLEAGAGDLEAGAHTLTDGVIE